MAKSVMISIRPEWVQKILSGEKTVEVRKTAPKIATPFKCYIYCTQPKPGKSHQYDAFGLNGKPVECGGKVVGEFVCDRVFPIRVFNNGTIQDWNRNSLKNSCVPYDDIVMYIGNNCSGYGWHISDLKVYDNPEELNDFNQCHKCELHDGCKQHEYSCAGDYKLKRPPQSWCYVEEHND